MPKMLVSCFTSLLLRFLAAIKVYKGTFIPASRAAKQRMLLQDVFQG
jgi:hypothetical protein